MELEQRYIVLKVKDLELLNDRFVLDLVRDAVHSVDRARQAAGKSPLQAVVIEQDWPEYEPTVALLAARVDGTPVATKKVAEPTLEVAMRTAPVQDERGRVAAALRACDWSGTPIGNKAIVQRACELLTTRPAQTAPVPVVMPAYRTTPDQSTFKLKDDWQNRSMIDAGFNTALNEVARLNAAPQPEQTEQQPVAEAPAGKKVGELMVEVGFSGNKVSELVQFILDAVAEGRMTAECGEELGRHLVGLDVGEVSPDVNVERNRKMLLDRSKVGLEKYGVTTERTDLTPAQWAQHAIEEALDFANYLQALKSKLEDLDNG